MDNIPTLYKNVIDGLPSKFTVDTFLWATDKFPDDRMVYRAEAFAREADGLMKSVSGLLNISQMTTLKTGGLLMNEDQEADLLRFFQARHANSSMGGNVRSTPPEFIQ